MAQLAEPLMKKDGILFTMTYYGSRTVVKNYNIMGVAKAALESAVRYVSAELGPKGIRVRITWIRAVRSDLLTGVLCV